MKMNNSFYLCGFMGVGKTTILNNIKTQTKYKCTDLDENIVQFIVDESPERCGRYIANTKIPIVDVETLKNSDVDMIIIFAWNYSKMIIEKTQFKNYKYLVAFPNVQLVNSYDELEGFDSI